ncbi:DUF4437 domain-containing protein [Carboxylicivirga sp. N1Y90]|uniref:DUF4437 domain-containing protein n=1 Tax=Carboxylicivirga fragile TaxID=3417571 RepID=UPI003D3518A2|nr:DUF4437 domain-containing protein [Marinilabiliaceae bacterium N1Y90]
MKNSIFKGFTVIIAVLLFSCNMPTEKGTTEGSTVDINAIVPTYKIIQASEVEWTHLNPKRGDLAPKAGTLWGDRKGTDPTGFLLKPSDGFESPPHIHNVSYHGIVISGIFHNDDPTATNMWLPQGSFWTQPKGEVHITAAEGSNALAYIEIEEGPYLVLPEEDHFDSGERPVNVDHSNVVWLDAKDLTWYENSDVTKGAKMAFLWGKPRAEELNGTFLKLPPKFSGKILTQDSPFRAVVIKGEAQYHEPSKEQPVRLLEGSFFSSEKQSYHTISNYSDDEVLIYIRSFGAYSIL